MYSIGKLCAAYKLSRSTLLYYDKIKLLVPSGRTGSNYRKYSEEDKSRLGQICTLREAGVALEQIKNLLDSDGMNEGYILEKRLKEINSEIQYLRFQQKIIVEMLKVKNIVGKMKVWDLNSFVPALKSIGIKEEMMEKFHGLLEKNSPDIHQALLEFLGFSEEEIEHIRKSSKQEKAE